MIHVVCLLAVKGSPAAAAAEVPVSGCAAAPDACLVPEVIRRGRQDAVCCSPLFCCPLLGPYTVITAHPATLVASKV